MFQCFENDNLSSNQFCKIWIQRCFHGYQSWFWISWKFYNGWIPVSNLIRNPFNRPWIRNDENCRWSFRSCKKIEQPATIVFQRFWIFEQATEKVGQTIKGWWMLNNLGRAIGWFPLAE
jgi:hypothetical protein